jgi:hypothetical protein
MGKGKVGLNRDQKKKKKMPKRLKYAYYLI